MKAVTILSAPIAKIKWNADGRERILCVEGFARKAGKTNALLESFLKEYPHAEIIRWNAYDENPLPCTGCDSCGPTGVCRQNDLDDFFEVFETADLIVFASPVYNLSFPAPLKGLLDRFQRYYSGYFSDGRTQPIQKRRKGYLLVTAGCDGKDGFAFMERQLKDAFSILNIEYAGGRLIGFTDKQNT